MGLQGLYKGLPDHLRPITSESRVILCAVIGAELEASLAPIGLNQRYF